MIAVCISVTTGVRVLAFAPLATVIRGTGGAGGGGAHRRAADRQRGGEGASRPAVMYQHVKQRRSAARIYAWLDTSIWPGGQRPLGPHDPV